MISTKHGLLSIAKGVYIAGGSIFSRLASFAALIIAARMMSPESFGIFATVIGISFAVAAVASTGFGDMLALGVRVRSSLALRFLRYGTAGIILGALIILVTAISVPDYLWVATAVSVSISTVFATAVNQVFRGNSRLVLSPVFGFYLAPTLRVLAVLALPSSATVTQALLYTWMALSLSGLLGIVVCWLTGKRRMTPKDLSVSADEQETPGGIKFSWVSGLAMALTWAILNQADLTSVTVFSGAKNGAVYATQMRIFETLTAISVGYNFVNGKKLQSARISRDRVYKDLSLLAAGFLLLCASAAVVGPRLLPLLFGNQYRWQWSLVAPFALAYLFSVMANVLFQRVLIMNRWGRFNGVCLGTIGVVALVVPAAAYVGGPVAAAYASSIGYVTWASGMLAISGIVERRRGLTSEAVGA